MTNVFDQSAWWNPLLTSAILVAPLRELYNNRQQCYIIIQLDINHHVGLPRSYTMLSQDQIYHPVV